jgi:hypothetical protein
MKVIVNQVAWIKVERHFTHELDINPNEYALIVKGEHDQYADIDDWAQDQELNGEYSDYDEDWLEDRIESVVVEEHYMNFVPL